MVDISIETGGAVLRNNNERRPWTTGGSSPRSICPCLVDSSMGFNGKKKRGLTWFISHVPIEHHPTIRYMVYNDYYKVMSNIPKMGHLPTPDLVIHHINQWWINIPI